MKILIIIIFALLGKTSDPFNGLMWDQKHNGDWYEWWYYKVIDQKTNTPFYFLYGIINPWDISGQRKESRSIVGFGNFKEKWWIEKTFPVSHFKSQKNKLLLNISELNGAHHGRAFGSIKSLFDGKEHTVRWDLEITPDWSFKAMGWTMGVDWSSNIFWYPAQASNFMSGIIEVDGKTYVLEKALGYQDRNWGKTFPDWWAWIVCNDFKNSPGTVLAGGGGLPDVVTKIKWPIFVLGLRHEGKEYSFRLNDGDYVRMKIKFGHWWVSAINKQGYRLDIRGNAPEEKFMDLIFLTPQGQYFHDYEALQGNLEIKLYKRQLTKWKLLTTLQSDQAGLEFGSFDPAPQGKQFELKSISPVELKNMDNLFPDF